MNANQDVGNYWIRALPNAPAQASFTNGQNSAILRYSGAAEADPTTTMTSTTPLVEKNLKPLVSTPVPGTHAPGEADINLTLNLDFVSF